MKNSFMLYGNKVFGKEVSKYGLENGYLDYRTLAEIVGDCILNNSVRSATDADDWELLYGEDYYGLDEDGNACDMYDDECVTHEPYDIYQDYIISESGSRFLANHTHEIVYYNEKLDLYIWAITHYGTSWDYVLTNIELVKEES